MRAIKPLVPVLTFFLIISFSAGRPAQAGEQTACLHKIKIPGPETRDLKKAEAVVTCVLKFPVAGNGTWWKGAGLAGASMIPREPYEAFEMFMGYAALFESGPGDNYQTKLERSANGYYSSLLSFNETRSLTWATRREQFLALTGITFREQFVYGEEGNYGRVIAAAPRHQNVARLANALSDAYDLYLETAGKGFDDATLGDAVGLAAAFLKFRGLFPADFTLDRGPDEKLPFTQTVYDGVLASAMADKAKGVPFFYALKSGMAEKGLASEDVATALKEPQTKALAAIVASDFSRFRKVRVGGETVKPVNQLPPAKLQMELKKQD